MIQFQHALSSKCPSVISTLNIDAGYFDKPTGGIVNALLQTRDYYIIILATVNRNLTYLSKFQNQLSSGKEIQQAFG